MTIKGVLGAFLLLSSVTSFAADDDCPNAVDAAEAQNPNLYKHCDYTKTGLNGVVHRALANKTSDAEASSASEKGVKKAALESEPKKITTRVISASNEFSTPEQLQQVRFGIVKKAIQECVKGFVIDSEAYLPIDEKRLKLELNYHCL